MEHKENVKLKNTKLVGNKLQETKTTQTHEKLLSPCIHVPFLKLN